jgi:hypothetical protein
VNLSQNSPRKGRTTARSPACGCVRPPSLTKTFGHFASSIIPSLHCLAVLPVAQPLSAAKGSPMPSGIATWSQTIS